MLKNVEEFGIEHAAHGSESSRFMVGQGTDPARKIHRLWRQTTQLPTGAFGAIAFGIGTSEVEHVFATQTLWQVKPRKWTGREFHWCSSKGVYSEDYILLVPYGVACGVSCG